MLFIRRTIIRKHDWAEGRMERGWGWGGGGERTIQTVAHITCGISRSSQNGFSVNVCGCQCCPTTSSLDRSEDSPAAVTRWCSSVVLWVILVLLCRSQLMPVRSAVPAEYEQSKTARFTQWLH